MNNFKSMIMILVMLTSILSGCTSTDTSEIDDLEKQITDLQQDNDNLTAQLETSESSLAFFNNLAIELQSSLASLNETVLLLNNEISENENELNQTETQRDELQIELELAIASNSTTISELEGQLESLNTQISQLNSDSSQLQDDLENAVDEISSLTNSLNAIEDKMSRIMYQTFTDVNDCPLSDPTKKIKIGHDDSDNGQLTGNEIDMIVGECSGDSGIVASIGSTGGPPRDARISQSVEMGGVLYFTADDGIHGNELWKSDGTLGGTEMVIDLTPAMCPTCTNMDSDIRELVAGDSHLFFASTGLVDGFPDSIRELYVSDGTESGTEMVIDLFNCPTSTGEVTINYEGVNSLLVIPGSSYGIQGQDRVVFSGFSCSYENWVCFGEEPWISDGTLAGTIEIDNLRVGDTSISTADGQGTVIDTIGSQPRDFFQSGETIYFTADDNESGRELWKFNLVQSSSTGADLIKDIYEGSDDSFDIDANAEFTQFGDEVYFVADDGITGVELWKTNGTIESTILVRNIDLNANSSNPKHLTVVNDEFLYFVADDGSHGRELWQSNGTWQGTNLFSDILDGEDSSNPRHLMEFDNGLYVVANNGTQDIIVFFINEEEYHIHSGYVLGSVIEIDITNPSKGIIFNDSIYFTADEGLFQLSLFAMPFFSGDVPGIAPVELHHWNLDPEILTVIEGDTDGEEMLFLSSGVYKRYLFYHWDNPYSNLHYI
jgi:ELWxxDGT repeat protein